MNRVITDLSKEADDAIAPKVNAIIVGCTGNANFTVTTQLAAVVTALGVMKGRESLVLAAPY